MTQERQPNETRPEAPPLKVVEREPDPKDPWSDDVLERREIADRLTRIVATQEAPFVISVDGNWGTGKTFLLRRWQQHLENRGWQAIYYNAWEDDFAGDPLVSITGQLSEHFQQGSLKETVRELVHLGLALVDLAAPLTPYGPIWAWLRGAARKLQRRQAPPDNMRRYLERRATTDDFQRHLAELGAAVRDETGKPLLFIIDELDRCRPTFAIELLERVKHIFDVDNIVFIFGINRSELVKALESVYGEIDAATYLRRFFDMEFTLPDPDPRDFCEYLFHRYGLDAFLASQSDRGSDNLPGATHVVPFLLGTMGLSLRDMDHCMRLLSLAARDSQTDLAPTLELFATLVALKATNQELYRDFVSGAARGADVINYINTRRLSLNADDSAGRYLEGPDIQEVEAALYAADSGGDAERQVVLLLSGRSPTHPESLAPHHRQLSLNAPGGKTQLEELRGRILSSADRHPHTILGELAQAIDLHHGSIRR